VRSLSALSAILVVVGALAGCEPKVRVQNDIFLPEGDPVKGAESFVKLGCSGCHVVTGADLPDIEGERPVKVRLGSSTRIKSYGNLVTSIVNPSHRISRRYRAEEISSDGESFMPVYNDVMTVTELTNLTAFLRQHYERVDRPRYQYRTYPAEDETTEE